MTADLVQPCAAHVWNLIQSCNLFDLLAWICPCQRANNAAKSHTKAASACTSLIGQGSGG
jgi:hypothetical protein